MLKKRVIMYGGVFIAQLTLSMLLDDPVTAGIIVLSVFMTGYIAISLRRQKKRIALLDEACDPEAFLIATLKQHEITGRNKKYSNYLRLDMSAGQASAGRFDEALETLDGLDESIVNKHPLAKHAMVINRYVTLRSLACHEEADRLFESRLSSVLEHNRRLHTAINLARLDYEFHRENHEACRALIEDLKSKSLSRRYALTLRYFEAELALAKGDAVAAETLFKTIVDEGNGLHIVKRAQDHLQKLQIQ